MTTMIAEVIALSIVLFGGGVLLMGLFFGLYHLFKTDMNNLKKGYFSSSSKRERLLKKEKRKGEKNAKNT